MKATLEFDLDNPDDRLAHMRCVKSTDLALAIFHIENFLMKCDQDITPNEALISGVREILSARNIVLDEMLQ